MFHLKNGRYFLITFFRIFFSKVGVRKLRGSVNSASKYGISFLTLFYEYCKKSAVEQTKYKTNCERCFEPTFSKIIMSKKRL